MGDAGVTVVASDNPTGEEGYEVICRAADAEAVLDTLINHGLNAAPFGYRTWESLTLEAGTPLFETELDGRIPNTAGLRHALDFEKGCYVGQELVSKVANRGQPSSRLVGLRTDSLVEAGSTITVDGEDVGEITRAVEAPSVDAPIALAFVEFDATLDGATVETTREDTDPGTVDADVVDLPFVTGSADSLRLPTYSDESDEER
jgi:aminomethyltransferase